MAAVSGAPVVACVAAEPQPQIEFVLDLSGSMSSFMRGGSRINLAKHALLRAVRQLPAGASFGVRAFAHRFDQESKEKSCKDSEQILPISWHREDEVRALLAALQPRGFTPLAYSLSLISGDFKSGAAGKRVVILLSDGADSCGGDPVGEVAKLREAGIDVQVQAIGLQADHETRAELQAIASISGGEAFVIESPEALDAALSRSMQVAFAPSTPLVPSQIKNLEFGSQEIEMSGPYQRFNLPCLVGEKFSMVFSAPGSASSLEMKLRSPDGTPMLKLSGKSGESEVVQSTQTGTCHLDVVGTVGTHFNLTMKKLVGF